MCLESSSVEVCWNVFDVWTVKAVVGVMFLMKACVEYSRHVWSRAEGDREHQPCCICLSSDPSQERSRARVDLELPRPGCRWGITTLGSARARSAQAMLIY